MVFLNSKPWGGALPVMHGMSVTVAALASGGGYSFGGEGLFLSF